MQMPHTLLDDIQDYLKYLREMGVTGFECAPETLARIDAWNKPPMSFPGRPASQNREKASENLEDILSDLASCSRCGLSKTRNKLVFGEGNPKARLVFVGEAPGFEENASGKPFVGPAGQLLTKIIQAIHLDRDQVYICNIVKCRPPGNRNPEPDEIKACLPFLQRQLRVIEPDYICALGSVAAQTLLDTKTPISQLRGHDHMFGEMKVLPTYHPSYLLRNPEKKRDVWEDMQRLIRDMDLKK